MYCTLFIGSIEELVLRVLGHVCNVLIHLRYTVCVGKHWPALLLNTDVVEDTQYQSTMAIISCTQCTWMKSLLWARLQLWKLLSQQVLCRTKDLVIRMNNNTYSEGPLVLGGFQVSPFLASVWGQRTGLESDEVLHWPESIDDVGTINKPPVRTYV